MSMYGQGMGVAGGLAESVRASCLSFRFFPSSSNRSPLGSQYTLSYLHQLLKMDEPLLEYLASKDLAALMDVLWCVLDGKG